MKITAIGALLNALSQSDHRYLRGLTGTDNEGCAIAISSRERDLLFCLLCRTALTNALLSSAVVMMCAARHDPDGVAQCEACNESALEGINVHVNFCEQLGLIVSYNFLGITLEPGVAL